MYRLSCPHGATGYPLDLPLLLPVFRRRVAEWLRVHRAACGCACSATKVTVEGPVRAAGESARRKGEG